ncbi:MAG: biotin synthase BioB [Candidatus Omnitrophica bacterium]|nr:biotin synthase BioB [Candidatus Omnitrophota bacterium]
MQKLISNLTSKVLSQRDISKDEALSLLQVKGSDLFYLFASANSIRQHFRGNKISLCTITNAKSGDCFEDCKFCAQSRYHNTNIAVYPLISVDEMLRRAEQAIRAGTHRFCLVTSGGSLDDKEMDLICEGISRIKNKFPHIKLDASLGKIDYPAAKRLKEAGLNRYNHNLETVPEYFSQICSTHTYRDRLETISILKQAGLEICCGGILGMGENETQRVEFGFILKGLDLDSIALNFLNPIPGTGLAQREPSPALELIKIAAILRFILPDKEIRLCGGREKNLRGLQALAFCAGIDATIIGDYLTTKGNPVKEDLEMLIDLGFSV